ncbi:MAG: hypothetical protein LBM70_10610, partial [Victivallales bacterium]|nr:hypothetical protein [Victivallales bacterium]
IGELGYAFLFRNYRPEQGKWQTADPLGYPDGWNNLAYVNNGVSFLIDFLGLAPRSITSDGIKYTWDWGTSKISGVNFIPTIEGIGMGDSASVTWQVTVNWSCVCDHCLNCQCQGGSFTHSTDVTVDVISWIEMKLGPSVEIPTFNSILNGLGEIAANLVSGVISMPVIVDGTGVRHIINSRPASNTPLTNMKPVDHICE